MTDENNIIEFQHYCDNLIYETVMTYLASTLQYMDQETSAKIVIESLSKNLGIVLAQFPENIRENWNEAALKILNKSILDSTEHISYATHGQVGHA
jgi:hypothetical protein